MNFIRRPVADIVPSFSTVEDPADLRAFLDPESAGAIWRRQTPLSILTWLDELDECLLPRTRTVVPRDGIYATLKVLFDACGLPAGPQRDWLQSDITMLADTFANLMRSDFLRLRLEPVTTNACRKFHVDAITARLVCTYRGTGTQYGLSKDRREEPDRIFTVATGDPILLRGTLWPENLSSGLLHRSPPIEGTGETRLVLVLDPVSGLNED